MAKRRRNPPPGDIKNARLRTSKQGKYRSVAKGRSRRVIRKRKMTIPRARPAEMSFRKVSAKLSRRPKRVTFNQLRKVSTSNQVLRYQNITQVDINNGGDDHGANWLGMFYTVNTNITGVLAGTDRGTWCDNQSTLSVGTEFIRCGYHLYNLTLAGSQVPQGQPHHLAYQPFINTANGDVTFTPMGCPVNMATTGTTTGWQIERWDQGVNSQPKKYIRQDWYDVRLCLRNPPHQQTYFDVWVFQFRDGYLDPLESPSTVREIDDRHAFYHGLAREGYQNPVFRPPGLRQPMSKVRVIKKLRYVFNRSSTDDADNSPDMKYIHFFIRDGKLYDYQWTGQSFKNTDGTSNAVPLLLGSDWKVQGSETNLNTTDIPKSRARVWLMVRAYDPTITGLLNGAGDINLAVNQDWNNLSNNNTPSYDICIRKSETSFTS